MIGIINSFIKNFLTLENHMIWISNLPAGTEGQIVIRDYTPGNRLPGDLLPVRYCIQEWTREDHRLHKGFRSNS